MKSFKNKKGFTLIELLIVIAIIGILAVAFLPNLLSAPSRARDAQRIATLQKLQSFLVQEYITTGETLPASSCINEGVTDGSIGEIIGDNIEEFGGNFPLDPQATNVATGSSACSTPGRYGYVNFTATGLGYSAGVFARVENESNGNIDCDSIDTAATTISLNEDLSTVTNVCYIALLPR